MTLDGILFWITCNKFIVHLITELRPRVHFILDYWFGGNVYWLDGQVAVSPFQKQERGSGKMWEWEWEWQMGGEGGCGLIMVLLYNQRGHKNKWG